MGSEDKEESGKWGGQKKEVKKKENRGKRERIGEIAVLNRANDSNEVQILSPGVYGGDWYGVPPDMRVAGQFDRRPIH